MIDVRNEPIKIIISEDRQNVLVTASGCFKFRAQKIPELEIVDSHKKKPEFLSISPRAHWSSVFLILGGFGFGYLFILLGLNTGVGTLVGAVIGGISGYFIGRRIENKEK